MTEEQWTTARHSCDLLRFIEPRTTDRKLHYYGIACARRIAPLLHDPMSLVGVNVLESFVEGKCGEADLRDISYYVEGAALVFSYSDDIPWLHLADQLPESFLDELAAIPDQPVPRGQDLMKSAAYFVDSIVCPVPRVRPSRRWPPAPDQMFCPVSLVHEVFGNPFRTMKVRRHWRTATVLGLAQSMYESKDFSAMPVLADALEEAGCDSADVLFHCRRESPHVRGCWVVDRLLCKK